VESTLIDLMSSPFAGRRRQSVLAGMVGGRAGASSPLVTPGRRLGCSGEATRRGPCVSKTFLTRSRPAPSDACVASALLSCRGVTSAAIRERDSGLIHESRVERSFEVCSRIGNVAEVGRRRLIREALNRSLPNRTSIHADGV